MRQNRLTDVTSRSVGEKTEKVTDSHRKDMSPLTQGLNYRSACDGYEDEMPIRDSEKLRPCCNRLTTDLLTGAFAARTQCDLHVSVKYFFQFHYFHNYSVSLSVSVKLLTLNFDPN